MAWFVISVYHLGIDSLNISLHGAHFYWFFGQISIDTKSIWLNGDFYRHATLAIIPFEKCRRVAGVLYLFLKNNIL